MPKRTDPCRAERDAQQEQADPQIVPMPVGAQEQRVPPVEVDHSVKNEQHRRQTVENPKYITPRPVDIVADAHPETQFVLWDEGCRTDLDPQNGVRYL